MLHKSHYLGFGAAGALLHHLEHDMRLALAPRTVQVCLCLCLCVHMHMCCGCRGVHAHGKVVHAAHASWGTAGSRTSQLA